MHNTYFCLFVGNRVFTVIISIIVIAVSILVVFLCFYCGGGCYREHRVRMIQDETVRNVGRARAPRRRRRWGFPQLPVFPQILPNDNDPDHGEFDDLEMENVLPRVIELPWQEQQPVQHQQQPPQQPQRKPLLHMIVDMGDYEDCLYRETNM